MKEKKQLLTDEEYKQVILMAVTGKPQTEEQLSAVIKEAETMRCNALMLESVMSGLLCMYDENGTIMFSQPNDRTERQPPGTAAACNNNAQETKTV